MNNLHNNNKNYLCIKLKQRSFRVLFCYCKLICPAWNKDQKRIQITGSIINIFIKIIMEKLWQEVRFIFYKSFTLTESSV